jgi:Domain of unknown function (DUF1905)
VPNRPNSCVQRRQEFDDECGSMLSWKRPVQRGGAAPHPRMPRYVVLPDPEVVALGLDGRVTVDGELNGVAFARKSVKPWGDGRFFLDLPQSLCRRADADTGDSVEIVLVPVSDDPPDDLVQR